MKSALLFDFTVDNTKSTVYVTREFAAQQSLVWDAFTTKEILDQWWAPKPWESRTKHMNFEEGGRRFYAMVGPDGTERWALQKYRSITPISNFKMLNTFADENENPDLPGSEWDFNFSEADGKTTVKITITNESKERFEKMLEYGFKEGFSMTINSLDDLLEKIAAEKK